MTLSSVLSWRVRLSGSVTTTEESVPPTPPPPPPPPPRPSPTVPVTPSAASAAVADVAGDGLLLVLPEISFTGGRGVIGAFPATHPS